MQCIASLFNRIDPSSVKFNNSPGPLWTDYTSSRQYTEICEAVKRAHPDRSPYTGEYIRPLGVMVIVDKDLVGCIHETCVFPLHIAFTNQDATVRYKNGVMMVANLPIMPKRKMKKDREKTRRTMVKWGKSWEGCGNWKVKSPTANTWNFFFKPMKMLSLLLVTKRIKK